MSLTKTPTCTPADAKGLLRMAIDDPNPVLFFEHKYLYRSLTGPVAEDDYLLTCGRTVREGQDATLITYGLGCTGLSKFDLHPEWDVEVIDLRTSCPGMRRWSWRVSKTGKALVLHEDTMTGIGAEISARIHEMCLST